MKASEWNIKCVNHVWIEDCFKSWALKEIEEKHVYFPCHLNELVGQIPVICKRKKTMKENLAPIDSIQNNGYRKRKSAVAAEKALYQFNQQTALVPKDILSEVEQIYARDEEVDNNYCPVKKKHKSILSLPENVGDSSGLNQSETILHQEVDFFENSVDSNVPIIITTGMKLLDNEKKVMNR